MGLHEEIREAELLVYGRACPNCGGFISDKRLKLGIPCTTCLPEIPKELSIDRVYTLLKDLGKLKRYEELYKFNKVYEDLVRFFIRCVGNEPWSIQKLWLKRVAKNASFAMIAPTGIGKTTFGIVVALYLAMKQRQRSYIIVPTTTLAMQLERKIEELASRADVIVDYVVIHSKLKRSEKKAREEKLQKPNSFDILVTTSNYLLRNHDKILKHDFKFIFVDDVDAVLRGSKAIDIILKLAGFDDEDIEKALRAVRLKRELAYRGEDPELLEKIREIESELEVKRRKLGKVVIIASATGNPRGIRVKLFKELMGFEIGARPEFIRNITDAYVELRDGVIDQLYELITRLGKGGLIYVPIDKGIEYAEHIAEELRRRGIRAQAMHSKNIKAIEAFIAGEIDVLVGVATYYGVLVRGIDLPETIRYAIFVGIPRHKIALRLKEVKAQDVLRLLPIIRDVVKDDELRRKIEGYIARMRRLIRRAGGYVIERLNQILSGERKAETRGEKEFIEAYNILKELTSRKDIIDALKDHPEVSIIEEEGELYILIPDAPTYIQASGRTSRLFLGGISKGLSIVLVDDIKLLKGLERRLKWIMEDFSFTHLSEVDIDSVIGEIDHDRELISKLRAGEVPEEIRVGKKGLMELKTALLVVESPNKARTIARFFGRPSTREYGRLKVYEVNLGNYTLLITASGGHIYDLIQDLPFPGINHIYGVSLVSDKGVGLRFIPVYTTLKRCLDKGHQFALEVPEGEVIRCPSCGSTNIYDAVNAVEAVRDVAMEVDEILVGTDPDTEGEKIAFDLINVILPYNKSVKRVEFHEVTRRAIINAINNPRDINIDLVKAQLVRRIEDRWIGFSLSKQLQTEFWQQFCRNLEEILKQHRARGRTAAILRDLCSRYVSSYRNLSAGRVQTPVLGWVIENYERNKATAKHYISINLNGIRIELVLPKDIDVKKTEHVKEVIVEVKELKEIEEELNPLPPYTTDAALSDISSRLGLPAPKVMDILQDLFELGFITYHRTDSTRISDVGINVAKEYLSELLGDELSKYFQPRRWGEGGAHEGIRPTRPIDTQTLRKLIADGIIEPVRRLTRQHFSVYDLIFRRFIASQSKPARVKKQVGHASVRIVTKNEKVYDLGEVDFSAYTDVLFDGFMKFYQYVRIAKPISVGRYILTKGFIVYKKSDVPLHTEASLIRMMKEREIGRPSTYAKIIDTLFKRNYITKRRGGDEVVPTVLGKEVYEYLNKHYGKLVNEERTRFLERKMKEVEEGKARYSDVIKELFKELESEVGIPGVKA